jgi:ATP-dependent Clp protease protease subunit
MLQYRERIIFLGKAIDEELGNQLVATMLYLDSENKKDINLYINCSGGDVGPHFITFCKETQHWAQTRCVARFLAVLSSSAGTHDGVQVVPCLALFDTMKYIGSDVGTVGFGGCMGMSGFLLAVGKKVCSRHPTIVRTLRLLFVCKGR